MSNINFNSVTLCHFMSYEHVVFNLDRNGYIFITGVNNNEVDNAKSNGSGKSSLFSAICWCLTGETPNGNKKVENIYLDGKTYVTVDFTLDGNHYVITRDKNPSNLHIIINGEDKSGKGIRDTEKLLQEYLPDLTSNVINSVIILGQGLPKRFTNNTPAGRKEILEKLSNSDFMVEDIKERINARTELLRQENNTVTEFWVRNTNTKDLLEKQKLEDIIRLNSIDIGKLEEELEDARETKTKIEREVDSYKAAKEESQTALTTQQVLLENITNEYNVCYNKLPLIEQSVIDGLVSTIATFKANLRSKQDEITKLKSVTDICPTCGQKIPGVVKLDTTQLEEECEQLSEKINEETTALNNAKDSNDNLVRKFNEEWDEKRKGINDSISMLRSDVSSYDNLINGAEFKYKEVSDKVLRLEIELNTINDTKKNLEDKIEELTKDIEQLEEAVNNNKMAMEKIDKSLDVLSKMTTLLRRDFRGYLLTNIIDFIAGRLKVYSKQLFGTDDFVFELDGNNINISYDGKEYESLSGGEKQKADVIIQLSIRDMLCSYLNFSSNILVLDEITDSLDVVGSQNVLNLISTQLTDVSSIYIISHHTDFSIPWDEEIIITKDNSKISRIV